MSSRVLTYATVCSGIECMSACCPDLPMKPIFFSEIEPFPCAILKSHYPEVPNLGDMSKIQVTNEGKVISNGTTRIVLSSRIDLLCGGTPCQDVSNAGLKRGMREGSGTRSSLAFEFVRLIRELKPRFILWENVAGVLSDSSYPEFLRQIAKCRYSLAYRVLDAQWVRCKNIHHEDGGMVELERAIPQRRRRVWLVGSTGGEISRAAKILFEPKSFTGDTPPSRRSRQEIAKATGGGDYLHDEMVEGAPRDGECVGFIPYGSRLGADANGIAKTIARIDAKFPQCVALDRDVIRTDLVEHPQVECYENHSQDSRVKVVDTANTLGANNGDCLQGKSNLVVFNKVTHAKGKDGEGERWELGDAASTRNTFDVGESRTQECIVDTAMSYDGYNQTGKEEICHTLGTSHSESPNDNTVVKIAQSFGINPQGGVMQSQTTTNVADTIASMRYIVRRLTPIECERLMGLPDGYTIPDKLVITDELVEEFRVIHDNFNRIMAEYEGKLSPRPKTANQIRKWLEKVVNPATCPDAPRYKACGNGWATNQPRWILLRLLAEVEKEASHV